MKFWIRIDWPFLHYTRKLYPPYWIVLQNAPHKSDNDKMHHCVADLHNVEWIQPSPSVSSVHATLQGVHVQVSTNETFASSFTEPKFCSSMWLYNSKTRLFTYRLILMPILKFLPLTNVVSSVNYLVLINQIKCLNMRFLFQQRLLW